MIQPIRAAENMVISLHMSRARIRDTPKTRATGDGFLAGGTHAKERSDTLVKEPLVPCGVSFPLFFPLVERKEAVGDWTRFQFTVSP